MLPPLAGSVECSRLLPGERGVAWPFQTGHDRRERIASAGAAWAAGSRQPVERALCRVRKSGLRGWLFGMGVPASFSGAMAIHFQVS